MFIHRQDLINSNNSKDVPVLEGDGQVVLRQMIDYAIELVKTKLQHRYDPDLVFIEVYEWDTITTYEVNEQIIYFAPKYDPTYTYGVGDRVSKYNQTDKNEYVYECLTDGIKGVDPIGNSNDWIQRGYNNAFYYCIQQAYNTPPTGWSNDEYWKVGDKRNPLIREYCAMLALHKLYMKVSPRNIPEFIENAKTDIIDHLDRLSSGKDTIKLPLVADTEDIEDSGANIHYSTDTQKDWSM